MGRPFFPPDSPAHRYEVIGFNDNTGCTMRCTVDADNTADAVARGVRVLERAIAEMYRWPLAESEWSYQARRVTGRRAP